MDDHELAVLLRLYRVCVVAGWKVQNTAIDIRWRIHAVMASVQRSGKLSEDTPHKVFRYTLRPVFMAHDHLAKIAIAAEFHVQMKVQRALEVVPLKILNNVWVTQLFENR
jgi:hypothetical protein